MYWLVMQQAILNSDQGWDLLYSSMQHGLSFNRRAVDSDCEILIL
jgi:hypothetical protein